MPNRGPRFASLAIALTVVVGSALSPIATLAAPARPPANQAEPPDAAVTSALTLSVLSARTNTSFYDPVGTVDYNDPVSEYKWLIVKDDAGNPAQAIASCFPSGAVGLNGVVGTNPTYPAGCDWPSIHATRGGTAAVDEIVTQGDQDDWGTTSLTLPAGKYVVSVLADGFKIDGAHFTVPMTVPGVVTVHAQPFPLPLSTIRVKVFADTGGVNGQWDEQQEDGLPGFVGHIADVLGEVTTDWFGNPLCSRYVDSDSDGHPDLDGDGLPTLIPGSGGHCVSDANGDIVIPNLGPNRYSVTVVPPNGQQWSQTTTLEGAHDWDTWVQEGDTGFDQEVLVGGEPTPAIPFGFVPPISLPSGPTGEVKGVGVGLVAYVPPAGGLTFGGEAGNRLGAPIDRPWVALTGMQLGDVAVYAGRGNPDGSFDIHNVPNGDYELTIWDQDQDYLVETNQVTVANGQVTDMGVVYLAHWFGIITGTVFNDTNSDGNRDPGEAGMPNIAITLRSRDNSLQDQGSAATVTDAQGNYIFREAYPLGQFVVEEVFDTRYYTTGITFQTDNQPSETTIQTASVDFNMLQQVGLSTRVDWGVRAYDPGTNGGIVGTVFYDTTRNELDARLAAVEDYEAGISGLNVDLFAPIPCGVSTRCDAAGKYQLNVDGSYAHGPLLNQYVTETWARPTGCVARDVNGTAQTFPWTPPGPDAECMETFAMAAQGDASDQALVNGNYGFGDACFGAGGFNVDTGECITGDFGSLPQGDYLVAVEVPNDLVIGNPMYQVRAEEDVNVFTGDEFIPQIPPPPCAGALHTVDVADSGTDGYPVNPLSNGVTVPASTPYVNPGFVDAGGSEFEGQVMPYCDVKLITLEDRHSTAPTFNFFTPVPVPGRFKGIVTDDLNLSTVPAELMYGEKAGIPNLPIGLYDFTGRLDQTIQTDPNGSFEVIMPSVSSYNCPLPAGPCPNVYRFVANDPGTPTAPNPNYNPQYRTIATPFQLWPNLTLPADLAPWTIAVAVEGPGTQGAHPADCTPTAGTPQLFRASRPFIRTTDAGAARQITLTGLDFGATQAGGSVTLGSTAMTINSWTDRQIVFTVPASVTTTGAYQLNIRRGSTGASTLNALTFHVLGNAATTATGTTQVGMPANPRLITVDQAQPISSPALNNAGLALAANFHTIQAALEYAATGSSLRRDLIVVYPNTPAGFNPLGAYFENVILHSPDKLQGVGPGGTYPEATSVPGSVIDGIGFNTITYPDGTTYADNWRALAAGIAFDGPVDQVYENAVITILSQNNQWTNSRTSAFMPAIDGFTIQGGDQMDFPGNLFDNGGGPVPNPVGDPTLEVAVVQGGGIFANAFARNLQITNNRLRSNGGTYGGAIRVGTPYVGDAQNDHVRILRNRITANGGTNFAGAVALFNGTEDYRIEQNQFCGNFSAEYGGAISHFGFSPNSNIVGNQIYFNGSYDEGAGIMVAGELPLNPAGELSQGSGPVNIDQNLIQANLANDDGGGLRFLIAGNHVINVRNNFIVDNISTHEGGGIALDDSTNVRIVNNTVMSNITTATSMTSTGAPMPAGLSDVATSALLQASLPVTSPAHKTFSDPLLFNNIFWDNRAGAWDFNSGTVGGIGLPGDPSPINYWDLGVANGSGLLSPTFSLLQFGSTAAHPFNNPVAAMNKIGVDPNVVDPRPVTIGAFPWRGDPHFIGTITIVLDPNGNPNATLLGDYHLGVSFAGALDNGTPSQPYYGTPVSAPTVDIDNQGRPQGTGFDMGADERLGFQTAAATFTALTPARLLDTRSGINNGLTGAFSANVPRSFQVTGRGGVPSRRGGGHRQPDRHPADRRRASRSSARPPRPARPARP